MPLEPGTRLGAERRERGGFDVHAGVVVGAGARDRLEHLCRYLLRPALAADRLTRLPDGGLLLRADAGTVAYAAPTLRLQGAAELRLERTWQVVLDAPPQPHLWLTRGFLSHSRSHPGPMPAHPWVPSFSAGI